MLSVADRFIMVQLTSRSLAAFHVLALQASGLSESPGLASSTYPVSSFALHVSVSSRCRLSNSPNSSSCRGSWRRVTPCLQQSLHIWHPSDHGTRGRAGGSDTNCAHCPLPSKYSESWRMSPWFWLTVDLGVCVSAAVGRSQLLFPHRILEPLKVDHLIHRHSQSF